MFLQGRRVAQISLEPRFLSILAHTMLRSQITFQSSTISVVHDTPPTRPELERRAHYATWSPAIG